MKNKRCEYGSWFGGCYGCSALSWCAHLNFLSHYDRDDVDCSNIWDCYMIENSVPGLNKDRL